MNEINFEIQDIEKIDLSMDVGVKEIFPPIENLEVNPSKEQQVFNHENSYGYDEVIVNPIPGEYIIPDGTLEITKNGVTDVTSYAKVNVNVEMESSETITPEDLTEELNTYNTELTEQETKIEDIIELLQTKTVGGGNEIGEGWITNCDNLFDKSTYANNTIINKILPYCKPTTAFKMFFQNASLSSILDVTLMDNSKCVNCESMFEDVKNIKEINLTGFNTSSCENMQSMFIRYNGTTLDLTSFDTSKVTNMSWMFFECSNVRTFDLSSFDFSNVIIFENMFNSCSESAIVYVKDKTAQDFILNLPTNSKPSSWSTSNVIIKI